MISGDDCLKFLFPWLFLVVCLVTEPLLGDPVHLTGPTMGTAYSVKIEDAPTGMDAAKLKSAIDAKLVAINQQMSTYIPDSEISAFNRSQSKEWFAISPEFASVTQRALDIGRATSGSFDVSIGMLVNLWGFGPEA
jgi:thiamine biosynthesis lipoprotein